MFSKVEGITKSEKVTSEDSYKLGSNFAWVLDGASGLTPTRLTNAPSDARWLVNEINKGLEEKIDQVDQSLVDIVQEVMDEVSKTLLMQLQGNPYKKYELPSSTVCLIRVTEKTVEYYAIGDSVILIKNKEGKVKEVYDTPLTKMEEDVLETLKKLSQEKNLSIAECRPFVQDKLIEYRNLKNTANGYWVFSIENNDAKQGLYGEIPIEEVESICLLSDGFAQYYEVLDIADGPTTFMEILENTSLETMFMELKKVQDEDWNCVLHPRLKKTDDTTGVYIKL